jgi:ABC-type glutathione transport system ATPase component
MPLTFRLEDPVDSITMRRPSRKPGKNPVEHWAFARHQGGVAKRGDRMRRGFAPWADPGIRPLVRFEKVSKRFGPVAAVDGLSLEIYEGEFFALLGPSGCGKTTLLRMLAGFEPPDQGRVLLGDDDIGRVPPYRRPVNMMFQSYALFPHLTVAGNVAFGLRQERLPRPQIADRVAEMLALVKLEGLSGRKPHQLSGGQRQRVALARSLAGAPARRAACRPRQEAARRDPARADGIAGAARHHLRDRHP